MVSLFLFTDSHRYQLRRNLWVLFLSPLNMIGGFPLRAPLEGLVSGTHYFMGSETRRWRRVEGD